MKKIHFFGLGLSLLLTPIVLVPLLIQDNKTQIDPESSTSNLTANGDWISNTDVGSGISYTIVVHTAAITHDYNSSTCPQVGQSWSTKYVEYRDVVNISSTNIHSKTLLINKGSNQAKIDFSSYLPNGTTAHTTHTFQLGVGNSTKPTFTITNAGRNNFASKVSITNYSTYLTKTDPDSVFINLTNISSDVSKGTVTVSGRYYSDQKKTHKGTFNQTISGFLTTVPPPTIIVNSSGNKVRASIVTASNYSTYLDITPSHQISSVVSITPHDTTGELDFKIKYYSTNIQKSGSRTETKTYNLQGFYDGNTAPKFSITKHAQEKVPSKVDNTNYTTYLRTIDPDNALIINDIKFSSNDKAGQLTISGNYYQTSDHSKTGKQNPYSYVIGGFARNSKGPHLSTNPGTAPHELPANVNASNFRSYFYVYDPDGVLIPSKFSFNPWNAGGELDINVVYYSTTYKGANAPTSSLYGWYKGFEKSSFKPTFAINQSNIQKITNADFNKLITPNNPTTTISNIKNYVKIGGIAPNLITNITFDTNTNIFTLYFHPNSSTTSTPISTQTTITGFATINPAPTLNPNQTNISTITESAFDKKIIANNPIDTKTNVSDYVTITGIAKDQLTNITYSNSIFKVFYRSTSWSSSKILSVQVSLSGFATNESQPTITISPAGTKVLPSVVSKSNYKTYLNISDQSDIVDVESITPHNSAGELDFRIKFYTTTSHTAGTPFDFYSYFIKGFIYSNTTKPTITINNNSPQILPSAINSLNYTPYLTINDPSNVLIPKDIKFTNQNDKKGTLTVSGKYHTTNDKTSTTNIGSFSYPLSGFANTTNAPVFTDKTIVGEVLPSSINNSNYTTYIKVTDSNNALITNDIKFTNENDKKGTLTVSGDYWSTTTQTSKLKYSYNLTGFANTNVVAPTFKPTSKSQDIVPSKIDTTNYTTYIKANDPNGTLIVNDIKFTNTNDKKGTLTISGSYWTSTNHVSTSIGSYSYDLSGFANTNVTAPTFTLRTNAKEILPSSISNTNYTNYLKVKDSDNTLITSDVKISNQNDKNGTLTISGKYWTSSNHVQTSIGSYSYDLSGFANTNVTSPVFSSNGRSHEILPSKVTKTNYVNYMDVTNPKTLIINDIKFSNQNDTDGTLTVSGSYWSSTIHTSKASTGTYLYNLSGFANTSVKAPIFRPNSSSPEILPSKVTNGNYTPYLNVIDIDKTLIPKDIKFSNQNDSNGTLTISGSYWTSTNHVSTSIGSYSYDLSGFANTDVKKPIFTPNTKSKEILPSKITNTNYVNYMDVFNTSTLITKDIKISNQNDKKGTLTISGSYWTSTNHVSTSMGSYSYDLSGFANSNVTKPVFKTNANSSSVFPSGVNTTNYSTYLDVVDPDKTLITKDITFSNQQDAYGTLKVSGNYWTSTNHVQTSIGSYSYDLSGFAIKIVPPKFTIIKSTASKTLPSKVGISNYTKYINVIDPSKTLIPNDIHFSSNNEKGELTISGTYYKNKPKTGARTIGNYTHTLNGFACTSIKPTFTVITSKAQAVLPSVVNSSNYSTYLQVNDPNHSLVIDDIHFEYNNSEGGLTVEGTYYLTSGDTTTSTYSYDLTSFGFPIESGIKPEDLALIIGLIISSLVILVAAFIFYYLNKTREERAVKAQIKRRKKRIQLQSNKNNFLIMNDKKMGLQQKKFSKGDRKYYYDRDVSLTKISKLNGNTELDTLIGGFQKTSKSVKSRRHNKIDDVNSEEVVNGSKWSNSASTNKINSKTKFNSRDEDKPRVNSKKKTKIKAKGKSKISTNKKPNAKFNSKAKQQTYNQFKNQQKKTKKPQMHQGKPRAKVNAKGSGPQTYKQFKKQQKKTKKS